MCFINSGMCGVLGLKYLHKRDEGGRFCYTKIDGRMKNSYSNMAREKSTVKVCIFYSRTMNSAAIEENL